MYEAYDKLHMLELKIAKEIKRICEKNEIPYFLTAGTLLGAVRHGGFIPWDDDMDIGMLRSDYNRFLSACEKDLGDEFFLQTWDIDPEYPFSFGKIRLKGTYAQETFSSDAKMKSGIFVDIFPYDNAPDSPKERKKQALRYFIYRRLLWIKKGFGKNIKQQSVKQAIKYYVFLAVASMLPYTFIKERFRGILEKYNNITTSCVVTDGGSPYEQEILKRTWVENLELIQFETESFLSYKESIEYLKSFYGDYMKLPPEDERYGHGIISVDYGGY